MRSKTDIATDPAEIRDAGEDDLAAIQRIYADAVLNGISSYEIDPPDLAEMRTRYGELTAKGYPYLVACIRGEIAGYAYAGPFRTRPAYRWLVENSIYVDPKFQGRGIGGALLAELITRCTALGFRQLLAVIGGPQAASVALHRKAGFTSCGSIAASGYKFGRWLDTAFMQLSLGEGATSDPDTDSYPGTLYRTDRD